MGNTKLNHIFKKTMINTNKLSVYIKNLMELNIVSKKFPVTENLKAKTNLHSGIYQLSDSYFNFYFRFLFP